MKEFALYNIVLTCFVGVGLASCAGSAQQSQLVGGLQETQARSPKEISGSLLDKCIDKFKKWDNTTFPEGKVAGYSAAGVYTVVKRFPRDPEVDSKVANLVSYKIAISKSWLDANSSYAYCYYKNSNGNLVFLESVTTNAYGDVGVIYLYSISSNIYYDLTGRQVRLGY